MSNPTGKNQYSGGSSGVTVKHQPSGTTVKHRARKAPKVAEVLKPGWVRKGSSLISPSGVALYSPRKDPGNKPVKNPKTSKYM